MIEALLVDGTKGPATFRAEFISDSDLLPVNEGIAVTKYTCCSDHRNLPADSWVEVWKLNVRQIPCISVRRASIQVPN